MFLRPVRMIRVEGVGRLGTIVYRDIAINSVERCMKSPITCAEHDKRDGQPGWNIHEPSFEYCEEIDAAALVGRNREEDGHDETMPYEVDASERPYSCCEYH